MESTRLTPVKAARLRDIVEGVSSQFIRGVTLRFLFLKKTSTHHQASPPRTATFLYLLMEKEVRRGEERWPAGRFKIAKSK